MAATKQTFESVWELCNNSLIQKRQEQGERFGRGSVITHCLQEYNIVIGSGVARKIVAKLSGETPKQTFKLQSSEEIKYHQDGSMDVQYKPEHGRKISWDELCLIFDIDKETHHYTSLTHGMWTMGDRYGYTTRANIKPNLEKINLLDIKNEILEELKQASPVVPRRNYRGSSKGKLFIPSIMDLHTMKLAHKEVSGDDYSTEIALDLFDRSIDYLVQQVEHENLEKIVLIVGSDMMNIDGLANQTTKGTPQHSDVDWRVGYKLVRQALVRKIRHLSQLAPVEVKAISGNHDFQNSFALSDALEAIYENDKNVTVDNSPKTRKFLSYGTNIWMFTHGNEEQAKSLASIFAAEAGAMGEWNFKSNKEIFTGHFHSKKKIQFLPLHQEFGITHRSLSSLSGTDSYHYTKGYISNVRCAEGYLYDYDYGYKSEYSITARELLDAP